MREQLPWKFFSQQGENWYKDQTNVSCIILSHFVNIFLYQFRCTRKKSKNKEHVMLNPADGGTSKKSETYQTLKQVQGDKQGLFTKSPI